MLMCSDGLTNMLEDREIHMIVSSQESVEKSGGIGEGSQL